MPRARLPHRLRCALSLWLARACPPRELEAGVREWRCLGILLVVERRLDDGRIQREVHAGGRLRSEELVQSRGRRARHGALREWSADGRLLASSTWRMGVLHGPARTSWPDGRLRAHGSYVEGLKDGEWWHADAQGRLDRARTGLWREGLRIGGIKGFNDWLGSP